MAVSTSTLPASPSSSPRLPSPPPIPEVQYGPQSPLLGPGSGENPLDVTIKPDEGAARRIRPGTKAVEMANGPPLVPLHQLDSPFQLQEHLKALYANVTQPPGSTTVTPVTQDTARRLAQPPQINDEETVDRNLWLYELCRFLTLKINIVIVALFADNPPCSSTTCPEMRASEWQYLCAVHEPPKSCCAIDYCVHTLDWAANVLTSPKHFPSRLALGGDTGNVFQSMRQLTNIFRRVYRIFAHAWFQHREIFWTVEAQHGLYNFFKTVCDEYQLIPEDNYTIPPEAQKPPEENDAAEGLISRDMAFPQKILPSPPRDGPESAEPSSLGSANTGPTVRRHTRNNPSTGSHVPPIAEGHEEEEPAPTTAIEPPPQHHLNPLSPARDSRDLMNGRGRLNLTSTIPMDIFMPNDPTPTVEQYTEIPGGPLAKLRAEEEESADVTDSNILAGDPVALRPALAYLQNYDDTPADVSDTKTVVPAEIPNPISKTEEEEHQVTESRTDESEDGDNTIVHIGEEEVPPTETRASISESKPTTDRKADLPKQDPAPAVKEAEKPVVEPEVEKIT